MASTTGSKMRTWVIPSKSLRGPNDGMTQDWNDEAYQLAVSIKRDGVRGDSRRLRLGFGFTSPENAKEMAVPAQERIGLHDKQGLPPERGVSSEQEKLDAVEIAEFGSFALALQDYKLLAKEGLFDDEIGLATRSVGSSVAHKGKSFGLEPNFDVMLKGMNQPTVESVGAGNHGAALLICRRESVSVACGCQQNNWDGRSNQQGCAK